MFNVHHMTQCISVERVEMCTCALEDARGSQSFEIAKYDTVESYLRLRLAASSRFLFLNG
eukprot:m.118147 g.118147  ORF g.118147 m.118147 type:complete len:60 (+) comp17198_c0_seq5:116-295(+)